MGQLSSETLIDEVFDELRDRLAASLHLEMRSVAWNDSARSFKQSLPSVLAALATVEAGPPRRQSTGEPAAQAEGDGAVTVSNVSWINAYGGGVKVLGQATNTSPRQLTVLFKAVFLRQGSIVETADGALPELGARASKTFEVQTLVPIGDFDEVRVQIEQSF